MLKEFKEFILKGSMLDLAVGLVIGAAFGAVVTSFVNDILMPPIGLLLGGVDFANLFINLGSTEYASLAAAQEAGAPTINYGLFIQSLINLIIVGFAIFMVVKAYNGAKKQEEAAPAAPPAPAAEELLLRDIRDLLSRR
jgi:large conductance mechanosensitive channel